MTRITPLLVLFLAAATLAQDPAKSTPRPVFVAAGHWGSRLISEDGKTWSKPTLGKEGETYRFLAFHEGRCLAAGSFGGDNIFAVTQDGSDWKAIKKEAKYVNYVRCMTSGPGGFLTISGDAGGGGIAAKCLAAQSKDGLTWPDPDVIVGKGMLRRAVRGDGKFVAVGDVGRRSVSADGKEWKDAPDTKALDTMIDVAFGNKAYVGVGLHGLRMTSKDGLTWENRQVGEEGEHLNSVLWTGDRFVAIGQGVTFFSPDGVAWKREKNENHPTIATYGNGVFVGSRWRGRLLVSTDAITWTETLKTEHPIEAIAFGHFEK